MKTKLASLFTFAFFLAISVGAYKLSEKFMLPALHSSYLQLVKPSWAISGTLLNSLEMIFFASLALVGWQIRLKRREQCSAGFPFLLFFLQIVLKVFWSVLFFGMQNYGWAFYEICLLWIMVLFTVLTFRSINSFAAVVMWPYLGWITYEAFLNFSIWRLNR